MADLILRELLRAIDEGGSVVLATITDTARSVPRHRGTKMLVYPDGTISGTIGGGQLEARIIEEALAALAAGEPRTIEYDLLDPGSGDPGVCGGTVRVYLEPYLPPATVYVVGCGHVGKAVVDLASWLGYRVVATDDRPELAVPDELPRADAVIAGPIGEALEKEPITSETWVVLVTRNPALDVEIIPELVKTPARYIGVMGSQRRWTLTRRQLVDRGLAEEEIDRVVSPIGVEIHAETPEEIALSIMAEVTHRRRT